MKNHKKIIVIMLICLFVQIETSFAQIAKTRTSPKPISKSVTKKPKQPPISKKDDGDDLFSYFEKMNKELDTNRNLAKSLFDKGDYAGAIKILTKLIESNFLDSIDSELRARAYFK